MKSIIRFFLAFIIGLLLVTTFVNIAQSQTVCADRAEFVGKLATGYSEQPVAIGLAHSGALVEVFASTERTFSVIVTPPSGDSCLVTGGTDWHMVPVKEPKSEL